jgi:hypothetical protein
MHTRSRQAAKSRPAGGTYSRSSLPRRTFAARRTPRATLPTKLGRDFGKTACTQGRGKPRSPAREAGPTVGPPCRGGLSPQGEPPARRCLPNPAPTLAKPRAHTVAAGREVPPGRRDLLECAAVLPANATRTQLKTAGCSTNGAAFQTVGEDREQQHGSEDNLLIRRCYAHQVHAVANDGDDKGTD